jgi:transposase InsO family protein
LASPRLDAVLALEVPHPTRPTAPERGSSRTDQRYVARQPALGHRADPRRAAQAGERGQQPVHPPLPPAGPARPPSQTWRTFLANHASQTWAADLFTVQTLTFKTLYVLLFIAHGRRALVHVNGTASPTAAWVWRQLIEATPWGRQPRYLVRDRDAGYGGDFRARAGSLGIKSLLTPIRAPRANAVAERVVGTLRRECLDHLIILNERHLCSVLREYVAYYNADRPHRSLDLEPPRPAAQPGAGRVRSRPILGGLHHAYERVA